MNYLDDEERRHLVELPHSAITMTEEVDFLNGGMVLLLDFAMFVDPDLCVLFYSFTQ